MLGSKKPWRLGGGRAPLHPRQSRHLLTHNLNTMMDLGITKEQATKLLNKLHVHAVTKLREIVIARRRLERNQQGKPPDTLDAG